MLVIAGCDAAEVFEATEHAFNRIVALIGVCSGSGQNDTLRWTPALTALD